MPIELLSPSNKADLQVFTAFCNEIFRYTYTQEQMFHNLISIPDLPSYIFVWKEQGKIVGANCFIPIYLLYQGEKVLIYQSCWSGIAESHRKKGIFQQLQQAGIEHLKTQNVAGILGIPNPNSRNILIQKLGYHYTGQMNHFYVFRLLNFVWGMRKKAIFSEEEASFNDLKMNFLWKQKNLPLLQWEDENGNKLWGKLPQYDAANIETPTQHLIVGGLHIAEPLSFREMVRAQMRLHTIPFMTIAAHEHSDYARYFSLSKKAPINVIAFYPFQSAAMDLCKRPNWTMGMADFF